MSVWRAQGKQVLQDDRHFADAAGELEAMMIVNAMRALDERDASAPQCYGWREGDEQVYSCGRRAECGEALGCADCGR